MSPIRKLGHIGPQRSVSFLDSADGQVARKHPKYRDRPWLKRSGYRFSDIRGGSILIRGRLSEQRGTIAPKGGPEEGVERIRDPKALCISSAQFTQPGFENQLQTVLNAFPAVVPHQGVFSSGELREALADNQTFDIVHIAAFVGPRSGDLYFTDVDLDSGESTVAEPDVLTADALTSLLEVAGARPERQELPGSMVF